MFTRNISTSMKWLFMVVLVLTLLIPFISCSDNLEGPRLDSDNEDEDDSSSKDEKGNSNISLNQIFEGTSGPGNFVRYV